MTPRRRTARPTSVPAPPSPRYQVEIGRGAKKSLAELPAAVLRKVAAAIDALAIDPRPPGVKKLADGVHRIRVGDFRVIYEIQDRRLIVLVVKVGNRGEVYRRLRAFRPS